MGTIFPGRHAAQLREIEASGVKNPLVLFRSPKRLNNPSENLKISLADYGSGGEHEDLGVARLYPPYILETQWRQAGRAIGADMTTGTCFPPSGLGSQEVHGAFGVMGDISRLAWTEC